jgi:hypothetical protein
MVGWYRIEFYGVRLLPKTLEDRLKDGGQNPNLSQIEYKAGDGVHDC